MLIVDGHEDIAFNALRFGRDPTKSAYYYRRAERGTRVEAANGQCMLGLPEWLLGHVGVIFSTLFVPPDRRRLKEGEAGLQAIAQEAYRQASDQLDFYHRLAGEHENIDLIGTKANLEAVVRSWADDKDLHERRVGLVPLMEGADPIREPAEVEEWFERGLRIVGLAWDDTRYSAGSFRPGPLTALGRELLAAMSDLPLILDLSHMAELAYLEALDLFDGHIIATHSNSRHFGPHLRSLSNEMIMRLAERGGVIGTVMFNQFLKPGYEMGDGKHLVTLDDAVAAIDAVCQLVGDAQHTAIGSDFDGGFGVQDTPHEFDTIADLGKIADKLSERGYTADDVTAIMGGNWLRILREALPD